MTRLRRMMLEELQRRNYSAITTRNYLRVVSDFAKYFGKSPDKLGPYELRTYQAYLLQDRKLTPGTVVNRAAATTFFNSEAQRPPSFSIRGSAHVSHPSGMGLRRPTVQDSERGSTKRFNWLSGFQSLDSGPFWTPPVGYP